VAVAVVCLVVQHLAVLGAVGMKVLMEQLTLVVVVVVFTVVPVRVAETVVPEWLFSQFPVAHRCLSLAV